MKILSKLICGTLLLAQALAAQQKCALCHPRESLLQQETPMAKAMQLSANDSTLKSHPRMTFQKGGFRYSVETQEGHTIYSVSDGTHTVSMPIKWALGVNNQTWIVERDGKFYESLVSYYLSTDALNITTGDEQINPQSLDEAFGRELTPTETRNCFNCHAANAVSEGRLNLATIHPGLNCERCHIGASVHAVEITRGKNSTIPLQLGSMSSEEMSNFCGQCHRTWETVVRSRERGPINVRFQPYRLANSKCFSGTDARISCVACHDPHQPLIRDAGYYDAKCLACHAQASKQAVPTTNTSAISCPVSASKCVGCHMPRVTLPNGLLTFTDHEIRIPHSGEYPN
jgi:formate-dependent nitrite reductase cytochrome c552 subunit